MYFISISCLSLIIVDMCHFTFLTQIAFAAAFPSDFFIVHLRIIITHVIIRIYEESS